MTAPWPPPAPQRPAPRPPSLLLVVLAVVLALAAQAGTVVALRGATLFWAERLRPTATSTAPTPPALPQVSGTPTPSRRPTPPPQSVGPVTVNDELTRGVVLISGRTAGEGVAGTGMMLTADGHVLTNYHVVRSTEAVSVIVASTGRRYPAQLVGRDATQDVALLKIEVPEKLEVVSVDSDDVMIGDVVVAAGNANGQGYVSAHRGNILGMNRSIHVRGASPNDPPQRLTGLIETNAPAWPGDSGGPMFDAEGEVLGMTTAGSGETETDKQVYAVPIAQALGVAEQILNGDESGSVVIGPKAYLGVVVQARDDTTDVTVVRVEPGTPASQVGLAEGDVITALDGQPIRSRADLSTVLDGIEPDQTVPISWRTGIGEHRSGDITVRASAIN